MCLQPPQTSFFYPRQWTTEAENRSTNVLIWPQPFPARNTWRSPLPLTSIAADSGRYVLQTVEVSGHFAKRHLGSSSRSRQLQRSPSPVDGLQSCTFFFLLIGRNVSRQTQTEFHGCWARGGFWLGCSFANVWMSIVFSKWHRQPQEGSRESGSARLSLPSH